MPEELFNIMIDPSLILAQNSIENTFAEMNQLKEISTEARFYYPHSLARMIAGGRERSLQFFLHNASLSESVTIRQLLDSKSKVISGFEVTQQQMGRYSEMRENLHKDLRYSEPQFEDDIVDILYEEWVFIQEYSWIVSRIKKPFNRFIAAGAICLYAGNRAVDKAIKRTLKKDDDVLNKIDRLRAFGKWIAVGGVPWLGLINPVLGAVASASAGAFLLFDP